MNSATSTSHSTRHSSPGSPRSGPSTAADASLRPWQFFLLAGMLCATGVVIVASAQSPASIVVLSLTVVSASLVAMGAYRALAPLVGPEAAVETTLIVGRTRAALEREKTLVLRSIKELEFDFAMGKIAKDDFDEMSGRLRARAIGLMRQLDAGGGYKAVIEQELSRRIAGLKPRVTRTANESRPESAVARDFLATGDGGATGVDGSPAIAPATAIPCECGVLNDPDARFCKNCGTKLSAT